jgi:hypothetical protein
MGSTVTFSRDGADLVMHGTRALAAGFWLPTDGIGHPARTHRRGYAGSPWIDGETLVSARLEHAALRISPWVYGSTQAGLDNRLDEIDDAVGQFTYTVTTQIGTGTIRVWQADPGDVTLREETWDARHAIGAFRQRVNILIPVHPDYTIGEESS